MSSGGFIVPHDLAQPEASSRTVRRPVGGNDDGPPLLKLTPKQERRLMTHVDQQVLDIERDFNKRADPSASMSTLTALLERLDPLLELILQIPPIDPSAALRISYLLRLTSSLTGWITGYPLVGRSVEAEPKRRAALDISQAERGEAMSRLLELTDELDAGWCAVLRGEAWYHGRSRSREGSWRAGTVDGEQVRQTMLGKGLTQTDRIRLRSAILGMRDKILSWSEHYSGRRPSAAHNASDDTDTETEEDESAAGVDEEFGQVADSWEGRVIRLLNGTLQMLADLGTF